MNTQTNYVVNKLDWDKPFEYSITFGALLNQKKITRKPTKKTKKRIPTIVGIFECSLNFGISDGVGVNSSDCLIIFPSFWIFWFENKLESEKENRTSKKRNIIDVNAVYLQLN